MVPATLSPSLPARRTHNLPSSRQVLHADPAEGVATLGQNERPPESGIELGEADSTEQGRFQRRHVGCATRCHDYRLCSREGGSCCCFSRLDTEISNDDNCSEGEERATYITLSIFYLIRLGEWYCGANDDC